MVVESIVLFRMCDCDRGEQRAESKGSGLHDVDVEVDVFEVCLAGAMFVSLSMYLKE